MNDVLIEIQGVSKTYDGSRSGHIRVLDGIDLSIMEGEFVSFLGPSGCGKTTLLKVIDDMIEADDGRVLMGQEPIARRLGEISFVFQEVGLLPWRTVLANVGLGLAARGIKRSDYLETAMRFVQMVGLERFAKYYPYQLSGGMRQRVGLARALAVSPKVLLMDEPFGSLDAMTRVTLQRELVRISEGLKITVIFVTHDIHEAIHLSDRVVVMSGNPGRVQAELQVNLPRPRSDYDVMSHPDAMTLHRQMTDLLGEEKAIF